MAAHTSITIRKLDPRLKKKLQLRAAAHGRSMEEEAREILKTTLAKRTRGNLYDRIRKIFEPIGFADDLKIPKREPMREPPDFSKWK